MRCVYVKPRPGETELTTFLTTKELAELLRIKERKVYDLASSGKIPCSRATGKLLFPRHAIESWIQQNASGNEGAQPVTLPNVILGSHDPLLEWAIRESRCGLANYFDSSLDGLGRFTNKEGIATGLHVYDQETEGWNIDAINSAFSHQAVVLVQWVKRQRGIIFKQGKSISTLADLQSRSIVPRQPEAGSQVLLNALLERQDINPDKIHWLSTARSEVDAVLAVQEGKADATFGLAALAAQHNLEFEPIIEEHFDLLVDRHAWFEPGWQTLLEFCRSEIFAQRVDELEGYRLDGMLEVRFNGA
ncbi:MAG: helix-turn-helix transcriptional regulator [Gammaproteobacteria bacterium]|nr:helix-turn-helix transcriptional regulator [Gammaproteobacteria bacterium]